MPQSRTTGFWCLTEKPVLYSLLIHGKVRKQQGKT